jgi:hypothetical protein
MARRIRYSELKVFPSRVMENAPDTPLPPILHCNSRRDFSLLQKNLITTHPNINSTLQNSTEKLAAVVQHSLDSAILNTSKELMDDESEKPKVVEADLDQAVENPQEKFVNLEPVHSTYIPIVSPPYIVLHNDEAGYEVTEYIAKTITQFCNDNDAQNSDDWRISIGLRDDILKSTTLHMALSRDSLILRFEIHDAEANALISNEVDKLKSMLDQSLKPQREVFITLN